MPCAQPAGCSSSAFFCTTFPPVNINKQMALAKSQAEGQQLRAAFLKSAIWPPNATLKFGFLLNESDSNLQIQPVPPNADPLAQVIVDMVQSATTPQAIKEAYKQSVIKIIQERFMPIINRNITFEDDVTKANIKVVFKSDLQSFAGVGNEVYSGKSGEDVHFGWWECGTIIHELGHVMGMVHEHQNPIGGQTLRWKEDLAKEYFRCQGWDDEMITHNVFERIDEATVNGSYFDPLSIMLYDYPACLTENNVATRRNPRWSAYDVTWMANNYGGRSITETQTAMGVLRETSKTMSAQDFFNKIYPDTPKVGDKDAYYSNIALSDAERVKFGGPLPPDTKKCEKPCGPDEFCDFKTGTCVKITGGGPTNPLLPVKPEPTKPTKPEPTSPTKPEPTSPTPTNPVTPVKPVKPPITGGGGGGFPCIGVSECPVICNSSDSINSIMQYKSTYLPQVDAAYISMSSNAFMSGAAQQSQALISTGAAQQSQALMSPRQYQPGQQTTTEPPAVQSGLSRTIRLSNNDVLPEEVADANFTVVNIPQSNIPPKNQAQAALKTVYKASAETSPPSTTSSCSNMYLILGSISALSILLVFLLVFRADKKTRR